MAVQYRASANSGSQSGTASCVNNVPAGTSNGDLMILVVMASGTALTHTPDAAWTAVPSGAQTASVPTTTAYYRVANSEPASYTTTFGGTGTAHITAIHSFYSDTATALVLDGVNPQFNASGDSTNAGVTTTIANTLLAACCVLNTNTGSAQGTGWTERVDYTGEAPRPSLDTKTFVGPGATGSQTPATHASAVNTVILIAIAESTVDNTIKVTEVAAYVEVTTTLVSDRARVTAVDAYVEVAATTVVDRARVTEVAAYVEVAGNASNDRARVTEVAAYVEVAVEASLKVSKTVAFLESEGVGETVSQFGVYIETLGGGILVTKLMGLVELEEQEATTRMALHAEKTAGGRYTHYRLPDEVSGYALDPTDSFWSVVVPEATVNFVRDPSFEYGDFTNWLLSYAGDPPTILSYPVTGAISGRNVCRVPYNGGEYTISAGIPQQTGAGPLTASLWIYAPSGFNFQLQIRELANVLGARDFTTIYTGWYRYSLTITTAATGYYRPFLKIPAGQPAQVIYTDAWQFEQKRYATTYCDGDQNGLVEDRAHKPYTWEGEAHSSRSRRRGDTRSGGREYNLHDDLDFLTTAIVGLGMAPVEIDKQSMMDGSELYRGALIKSRQFTITGQIFGCNGLSHLAEKRARLIGYLRPDQTPDHQPLILRYTPRDQKGRELARAVNIICAYQDGLTGNITNWYTENLPLQFYATKPMIFDTAWMSAELAYHTIDINDGLYVYKPKMEDFSGDDIEEGWHSLSPGGYGAHRVFAAAVDPFLLRYYIVGSFSSVNGQTLQDVTYTEFFEDEADVTWQQLSEGSFFDAYPRAVAVGSGPAQSNLVVMGNFTTYNGNPMPGVAWRGVFDLTWAQLGQGLAPEIIDGTGFDVPMKLLAMPNGDYYAIGYIPFDGNGDPISDITRYNHETEEWEILGDPGAGAAGIGSWGADLCLGPDGKIYLAGNFRSFAPNLVPGSNQYVCRYNPTTEEFESLAGGIPGTWHINAHGKFIWVGKDGLIYLLFQEDDTYNNYSMWRWNGGSWTKVLDFPEVEAIESVAVDNNGVVHLVGNLNEHIYTFNVEEKEVNPWYIRIDGNTVYHGGIIMANGFDLVTRCYNVTIHDDFIFVNTSGMLEGNQLNMEAVTVVNNPGNAASKPIIHIHGKAELLYIVNLTTNTSIQFSRSLKVGTDELVTLDFSGDRIEFYSNASPDYSYYFLGGASDLHEFRLAPGDNRIGVLLRDTDGNTEVWMEWRNTYWSADWS